MYGSTYSPEATVCVDQPPSAIGGDRCTREFSLNLRYVGQSRIEVRGAISGEVYRFSTAAPILPVDLRDAKYLLACNLFTIA